MYKMARSKLGRLLQTIAAAQDLLVPVREAGQVNFALWTETAEVDFDTLKTVKSPKDAFFPQSETLYSCVREGRKISVCPEELQSRPFVIFGVKGCDARGLEVLDRVFLSDPVDAFYEARRRCGTVVAMACREPDETCFCRTFGVDCAEPAADAAVWMTDETVYWKSMTAKGEALTELLRDVFDQETGEEEIAQEKEQIRRIAGLLPGMQLELEGWGAGATMSRFDDPLWEELYRPCLACGTCTFVCPTCQCYDIRDYDTGHGVVRYRCWDSCMYSDFTMMAHGNSRTSQMQRFRQRFMHKLVYFPDRYDGMYSCVGCGRCVAKCPASLNIVKVIRAFARADRAGTGGGAQT